MNLGTLSVGHLLFKSIKSFQNRKKNPHTHHPIVDNGSQLADLPTDSLDSFSTPPFQCKPLPEEEFQLCLTLIPRGGSGGGTALTKCKSFRAAHAQIVRFRCSFAPTKSRDRMLLVYASWCVDKVTNLGAQKKKNNNNINRSAWSAPYIANVPLDDVWR